VYVTAINPPASMEGVRHVGWAGVFSVTAMNDDDTSLLLRITNLAKRGGPDGQSDNVKWKAVRDRKAPLSPMRCGVTVTVNGRVGSCRTGTAIWHWHWHDCANDFVSFTRPSRRVAQRSPSPVGRFGSTGVSLLLDCLRTPRLCQGRS